MEWQVACPTCHPKKDSNNTKNSGQTKRRCERFTRPTRSAAPLINFRQTSQRGGYLLGRIGIIMQFTAEIVIVGGHVDQTVAGKVKEDGLRFLPVSYTHLTLPTNREV